MSKPFDVDRFVSECLDALPDGPAALRPPLERVVREAPSWDNLAAIREAGGVVHHAPDLTILLIDWPPGMFDPPHDHQMPAAVGVLAGREDRRRRLGQCDPRVRRRLLQRPASERVTTEQGDEISASS